jgi:hypothetical protein
MTITQLSAASLPSPNTSMQTPALPATPSTGSGINWALTHGLKSNRGLISAAIVASQSMKTTDFAADAAQNYKTLLLSSEVLGAQGRFSDNML